MPQIIFLPHPEICPEGEVIEAKADTTLLDAALDNGLEIEHACEKACACTTCHVIVQEGFESLEEASENEEDMLDKAWGLEAESRLSCQAKVTNQNLIVEIPKYSINLAKESLVKS
ncbi:ISC system 2Fe-2S type ferredoxin [Candidatus Halobeggiatoa sp. HSG11]|nr:ISC system 2Fe-2S type ferredoxin [Candidatus Halobeggiatoa sp. HSG11]